MIGSNTKIGRYQITRELGRGAMGIVYHAIDPVIGRAVAIKTLRLNDVDDADQRKRLRERLFREARSAGALSHPGIVTIYDMDEVDGLAYIAMEFVDGETLEDIMARTPPLPRERVIEIFRQAAAALDYAHRKGVIHRDIKPANIMIDGTGAVKITDFGIAKITAVEGQTLTGVLVGTPNYMSPEQVQGHEIDGRSDQFSLGVIAYEVLTGERPFHGEQISTVVYKIVADQPVPAQNVNPSLSETVDKALRRALAKKPERRFPACTTFITALETSLESAKNWRILPRKAHLHVPIASADEAVTRTVRAHVPRKIKVPPQKKEKRGWLVPFLGTFLLLLTILAIIGWNAGLIDPTQVAAHLAALTHVEEPAPAASQESKSASPPDLPLVQSDRPSPMPPADLPAETKPDTALVNTRPATPVRPTPEPANATYQQVQIVSDPNNALAVLDGRGDLTCRTPCSLQARSGVHNLTLTMEDHLPELREVTISHEDVEVPLIALRLANGLLFLTSDPSGATVFIDGQPTGQFTPVRIYVKPGDHTVVIEKNGLQATGSVAIERGTMTPLRLSVKSR